MARNENQSPTRSGRSPNALSLKNSTAVKRSSHIIGRAATRRVRSQPAASKYAPDTRSPRGWLITNVGLSARRRTSAKTSGGLRFAHANAPPLGQRGVGREREHPEVPPREGGQLDAPDAAHVATEAHVGDEVLEVGDVLVLRAGHDLEAVGRARGELHARVVPRVGRAVRVDVKVPAEHPVARDHPSERGVHRDGLARDRGHGLVGDLVVRAARDHHAPTAGGERGIEASVGGVLREHPSSPEVDLSPRAGRRGHGGVAHRVDLHAGGHRGVVFGRAHAEPRGGGEGGGRGGGGRVNGERLARGVAGTPRGDARGGRLRGRAR
jgi:hypothetical protein